MSQPSVQAVAAKPINLREMEKFGQVRTILLKVEGSLQATIAGTSAIIRETIVIEDGVLSYSIDCGFLMGTQRDEFMAEIEERIFSSCYTRGKAISKPTSKTSNKAISKPTQGIIENRGRRLSSV